MLLVPCLALAYLGVDFNAPLPTLDGDEWAVPLDNSGERTLAEDDSIRESSEMATLNNWQYTACCYACGCFIENKLCKCPHPK